MPGNDASSFVIDVGATQGIKGDVEVCTFMLTSTGLVACQPYVQAPVDKFLSNVPIESSLMFGTSQLPGILPQTIYSLPSTTWKLAMQELTGSSNVVSAVAQGRQFLGERTMDQQRLAFLSQFSHVYWLGPDLGPSISLAPGASVTLQFTVPSSADFDCKWILDSSTSTTGLAPALSAQIREGQSGQTLIDQEGGISWQDFIASPRVNVTGFPGGFIRPISLPTPGCCWTHRFKRSCKIQVRFISTDAGTITLNPCFVGNLLYCAEPLERQLTVDAGAVQARMAQAAQRGASPIRLFGQ